MDNTIGVINPRRLQADRLPVERIPVGVLEDQKPNLALLPDGTLLLMAFHMHAVEGAGGCAQRVETFLYRSSDGGRSWSERRVLELPGVEPYMSILHDGTVIVTSHVLAFDVSNEVGQGYSNIHRSSDGGITWDTTPILPPDLPGAAPNGFTLTSRNALELADGTVILAVGAGGGANYLWRSTDGGATWDKERACTFDGMDPGRLAYPLMNEAVLWQAASGELLAICRVDPHEFDSLPNPDSQPGYDPKLYDQYEAMLISRSRDGGRSWATDPAMGSDFGEMDPSILRLRGGPLLLTFTVRALHPPLGVQAVLGEETTDGFVFDFDHDRLVIDGKTPVDQISGGGFGNTVQLADGGLVTAYSYRGSHEVIQVDDFVVQKQQMEVARWRLR